MNSLSVAIEVAGADWIVKDLRSVRITGHDGDGNNSHDERLFVISRQRQDQGGDGRIILWRLHASAVAKQATHRSGIALLETPAYSRPLCTNLDAEHW